MLAWAKGRGRGLRGVMRAAAAALLVAAAGAGAQEAPLSLELLEVVPDPQGPQFPTVTPGHITLVDAEYGNYKAEYTWSEPPGVIGPDGFVLTLQTQAEQKTGGGITAGTTASGSGFSFDPTDAVSWAVVPNGQPGSHSASQAVRVMPVGLTWGGVAELRIGAAWGAGVTYRYRVTGEPPGGGTGAGATTGDDDTARVLDATVECDSAEIVISALPSLSCRLLISGWTRNTAEPVWVELPAAIDGYGNHANGLQLSLTTGGSQDVFNWSEPVYSWPFGAFGCPGQQGAGVNCQGSAMTPGVPASVPILVRQGDQVVTVTLTLNAVARGGTGGATGPATGPYRFGNLRMAGDFLNIEGGALAAGPIRGDWQSALWLVEPTGDGFFRLHSAWQSDVYLHVERQVPEAGAVQPEWWSAMWLFEPVEGTRYFRIRNRWMDGQYLHMEQGPLQIGAVGPDWTGALWWLME